MVDTLLIFLLHSTQKLKLIGQLIKYIPKRQLILFEIASPSTSKAYAAYGFTVACKLKRSEMFLYLFDLFRGLAEYAFQIWLWVRLKKRKINFNLPTRMGFLRKESLPKLKLD